MPLIDLRSDTVTQPTAAMRAVMAQAEVGDDVYGEDPTVNRLEHLGATLTGMEAALFVPTGTQSNLLGIMGHCERGDEYLVGQMAHTYRWEGGGAAVLGSIQPQPLPMYPDGRLDWSDVEQAIKPDDIHFARTRLLCLENTHAGQVMPLSYLHEAAVLTRKFQLALHLDGARVFNAAVDLGIPVAQITSLCDSVSVCLSKGLGAPVGSLLCGSEALIHRARRWRKVLGGGMRQAGILAAAGIYALEHHVDRLASDHAHAQRLADGLATVEEIRVETCATNMVFITVPKAAAAPLKQFLGQQGIRIGQGERLRLVTHLDIDSAGIEQVIASCKAFFAGNHISHAPSSP
ncbi:MAG: low-specificity L-threonine aldolase [Synechococcales cyanobacterium]